MSYVLALIGSAGTPRQDEAIDEVVRWHLDSERQAVWTDIERSRFAGGMRLVAKVAGAKVLAMTGTLVSGHGRVEPIAVDERTLRYRYDVYWDPRPPAWVAVEDVGEPFRRPTRTMRFINYDDWLRAYNALHGTEPPRQDAGRRASSS